MAFTYFFRYLLILELITKHVVPYVSGRSRIKVWDAGCAMGPEPYSLAIMFAESMGKFAFKNLKIFATDIDTCDTFGGIIAIRCTWSFCTFSSTTSQPMYPQIA